MSPQPPSLHLMCGKIASGKSTLTARLAASRSTIAIAEDDWLNALYADQMETVSDYLRCMSNLRKIIAPHVVSLLNSGVSVVLDFQANTRESRHWMQGILEQTNARHQLHVIDVPDEICIARLHARNAKGNHPFNVSEAQFHQMSTHFVAPCPDEGFNIVMHETKAIS